MIQNLATTELAIIRCEIDARAVSDAAPDLCNGGQ